MIATGGCGSGLAEGIIDDTCLVHFTPALLYISSIFPSTQASRQFWWVKQNCHGFCLASPPPLRTLTYEAPKGNYTFLFFMLLLGIVKYPLLFTESLRRRCNVLYAILIHQAPANRWSLVSYMVSVRPFVRNPLQKSSRTLRSFQKIKQQHEITLHGAWWITKFVRLVIFSTYGEILEYLYTFLKRQHESWVHLFFLFNKTFFKSKYLRLINFIVLSCYSCLLCLNVLDLRHPK